MKKSLIISAFCAFTLATSSFGYNHPEVGTNIDKAYDAEQIKFAVVMLVKDGDKSSSRDERDIVQDTNVGGKWVTKQKKISITVEDALKNSAAPTAAKLYFVNGSLVVTDEAGIVLDNELVFDESDLNDGWDNRSENEAIKNNADGTYKASNSENETENIDLYLAFSVTSGVAGSQLTSDYEIQFDARVLNKLKEKSEGVVTFKYGESQTEQTSESYTSKTTSQAMIGGYYESTEQEVPGDNSVYTWNDGVLIKGKLSGKSKNSYKYELDPALLVALNEATAEVNNAYDVLDEVLYDAIDDDLQVDLIDELNIKLGAAVITYELAEEAAYPTPIL